MNGLDTHPGNLWKYGAQPFVLEFIEFPQWTGNFRPPRARTFLIIPLTIRFFRLKTPGNFRDFLGDHFARVESSGDQNLTMFILHFHVFSIFDPPPLQKNMLSAVFLPKGLHFRRTFCLRGRIWAPRQVLVHFKLAQTSRKMNN